MNYQKIKIDQFNQSILDGKISLELRKCLCDNEKFSTILKMDVHGLCNHVVICKSCGLIQTNPRMNEVECINFYKSEKYRLLFTGEDYLEKYDKTYMTQKRLHIFQKLNPIMKDYGLNSILEIGCAGGANLIPFKKYGYKVAGYDYSQPLINIGKKRGLDLNYGSIGDINKSFDVIILNHVIEHFNDLNASMDAILNLLNPNGVLYVGVPNIDNFYKYQFQIAHVYYFTPRTFKYYMKRYGLELLEFGADQVIHMYAIYKKSLRNIKCNNELKNEYLFMLKKILILRAKEAIKHVLNGIGLRSR